MTVYPAKTLTQTMLGELCAALWDSQSRPVVIQPGIELGSVVTPLALRCSPLDRCSTRDAGLLGRVAKKKPYLRLANKNKRLRWAK